MTVAACSDSTDKLEYKSLEEIAKDKAAMGKTVPEGQQYKEYNGVNGNMENSSKGETTTTSIASNEGNINVGQVSVDDSDYMSSTKLDVSWKEEIADAYKITVTDSVTQQSEDYSVDESETEFQLTQLKAGTWYTITLEACNDEECETVGTATQTTEEEYWQILGEGDIYDDAALAVPDGSTFSYALQYGDWAPKDVQGETLFYYNPHRRGENAGVGFASQETDDVYVGNPFTVMTAYSLQHPCDMPDPSKDNGKKPLFECFGPSYMSVINAFQVVPLASGEVRLLFESHGDDHATRIMYLDSDDGYYGRDFNSGSEETCITEEDWNNGCKPTIAIGLDGDEEKGDTGLTNARQFKIGYPKQESWVWDESEGTFMLITGADSCEQINNGLFYAVWDGIDWIVEKDDEGCAEPVVQHAHGPVLVDLTPRTYKLYYEQENEWSQDYTTPKPFQMIYADASRTGDSDIIDIEDWEESSLGRDVHFIWPNGEPMSDEQEPGLGDHYIYLPTNNLDEQIMYMNLGGFDDLTWNQESYGLGIAILVNP